MSKKISLLVCVLFVTFGSIAQESLNNYKYVLVPKQYEFQKRPDTYQINSLHKFLFDQAGFETLFTDEVYPQDLVEDRCLGLTSKVVSAPSMFRTKFTVELYDCYNKLVYTSIQGFSKKKDYKEAYHETLRRAMAEFKELDYHYVPKEKQAVAVKQVENVATQPTEVIAATKLVPAQKVVEAETKVKASEAVVPVEKAVVEVAEVVPAVAVVAVEETAKKTAPKAKAYSIEGTYAIDMWGLCKVVKKGDAYAVIGGDEDFEFATITPTSRAHMYMIKKTGFKQTQLLELDADGNISIDTANGFKTYKRVN